MCQCIAGCCCSACFGSVSDFCSKTLGRDKVTKVCYLFVVVVFTVPAIVILFYLNKWDSFKNYFSWMSCPSSSGNQYDCLGSSTVFRISLSFLCLFGLMFLFMLCRARISLTINQGCFFFKYLLVLGIFIGFLFAPNQSFLRYADASKVISIAFMVLQAIILIDLFYLAGIKLVARYDEGQSYCAGVLIFLSIIFEALAVLLNVLGYIYFSSADVCGSSLWVNVINTIILVALPFTQLLHFNKQNSLLTTAMVSCYISYLVFVAQFSYGGSSCVGRMTTGSIAFDIIASSFLFLLTMYGSIMGGSGQVKYSENGNLNQAMGVAPTTEKDAENDAAGNQQPNVQPKQRSEDNVEDEQSDAVALRKYTETCDWTKWHFYMCIASIYMAMLITNWTSASPTTGELVSNDFGFWVRVVMSYVTTLLYLWTLIAPKCFPDRDFTVT